MRIESITIKNVRSFRETITFSPNKAFNVLIGANGSGKSNLMDIVYITLRQFFLCSYSWNSNRGTDGVIKRLDMIQNPFGVVSQVLAKYSGDNSESMITIVLEATDTDIDNLNIIKHNKELLLQEADSYYYVSPNIKQFVAEEPIEIHPGDIFTYTLRGYKLDNQLNSEASYYKRYLSSIEGLMILGKNINIPLCPLSKIE